MTAQQRDVDLADIRVQIAEVKGTLDTMNARMEAGDRQSAQLITLVKDQLTYHAADLGELKAIVRESSQRAEAGMSTVRVDLEKKINAVGERVTMLEKWQARLGGIAAVTAGLSAVLTALATKWIGGL